MTVVVTKSSLSPQRRRLLEICQQVGFGRVEHLVFEDREPLFDPLPRIVREIKFGGENGPRPELSTADFLLKQQAIELFAFFDEMQNGVIDVLEVKHGLPFRMAVEDRAA